MFIRLLASAALLSPGAFAAPQIKDVLSEIRKSESFEYANGVLRIRPSAQARYNFDAKKNIFTALDKSHRIAMTQEDAEGTPIWRLTESGYDDASGVYFAHSSTFYNNGPRSKTACFGTLKKSGDGKDRPGKTMSCTTASRQYCAGMLSFMKSEEAKKMVREQAEIANAVGGAGNLAHICQSYSQYLGKMSEAALNSISMNVEPSYTAIAKADTDFAADSLKQMRGWSVTQSLLSGPSVQGKDFESGAERAENLKRAAAEILSSAALVENCEQTKFTPPSRAGGKSDSSEKPGR